jgi:hypothetical protein
MGVARSRSSSPHRHTSPNQCYNCTPNIDSREADAMRKLTFGMNQSLDGYIAAPGGDLGWR